MKNALQQNQVTLHPLTRGTLYQVLRQHAQQCPQALALVFAGRRYSYQQFYQRVQQAMLQLTARGLRKGDRVLLAFGNHPAFCEVFFAALGLGIAVVPFSTKLKMTEGERLVRELAPQLVCYDAHQQGWLARVTEADSLSLDAWQQLTLPQGHCPMVAVMADDVAVMMFTSGTTGEPKCAIISHGHLQCAVAAYAQCFQLTAQDNTVLAVPIYHITGLVALLALFIYLGGSVWLHPYFHAEQVINTLRQQNIRFLHGSPTVFVLLCQELRSQQLTRIQHQPDNFPQLHTIACGAGHLNEGLIRELKECFPRTTIRPVYGLTETTSPATIFPALAPAKPGSCGLPIPGVRVKISDERGVALPGGQIGQICLQGEVVIRHYWQPQGCRPACDQQGWFYTGDLGYLDEDGYLFIKDRSKDMINRGGEKIYSIELENCISTYPGVKEVAIVAAPSQIYGEEPVAFVVPDEQHHLTRDELLVWLKDKVARFKLPVQIIFTGDLPRTHNGKINKRQLKHKLAEYADYFSRE